MGCEISLFEPTSPRLKLSIPAFESDGRFSVLYNHGGDPFATGETEQVVDLVLFFRNVNLYEGYATLAVIHLGCAGESAIRVGIDNNGGFAGLGHVRLPLHQIVYAPIVRLDAQMFNEITG